MNFSLSYNWLKELLPLRIDAQEFAKTFSLYSQTCDRVVKSTHHWKSVITAQIVQIQNHPSANRLRVVRVDAGGKAITVVCGASNIQEGDIVPLVLEGGEVLNSEGTATKIQRAVIRGVESRGMLCSERELGLGTDHSGIKILPPQTPLGVPLEILLPLNDEILEIEVTSNRPDCQSVVGIAREASAIFQLPLRLPPLKEIPKGKKQLPLKVDVVEKRLCPRYQAVVITGITVKPSPLWMQGRLLAAGIRPINNIVDITNYILLEQGQPMHAFDYDRLHPKGRIIVRKAKENESLHALDGRKYTLRAEDLVIADETRPIALAGVIGGEETAVTPETRTIIFESANFLPEQILQTSRRQSILTDSSNLFEKGLSVVSTEIALKRAVQLAREIAGGEVASRVIEQKSVPIRTVRFSVKKSDIEARLGIPLSTRDMKKYLTSLGFHISGRESFFVKVPWWRERDVQITEDIVEEVARMYGYHRFPAKLPEGVIPRPKRNHLLQNLQKAKDILVGNGFFEVYTYSFLSKKLLRDTGFSEKDALEIYNPLSDEMRYMRTSLIPGVLQVFQENQKTEGEMKFFELSNVYLKRPQDLPEERLMLCGIVSGFEDNFLEVKGIVEFFLKKMGVQEYHFQEDRGVGVFDENLFLRMKQEKKILGCFGSISLKTKRSLGIKRDAVMFEFDFQSVSQHSSEQYTFTPPPPFPSIKRDLAFVMDLQIRYREISQEIQAFHPFITEVQYLSTYMGRELHGKKSIALRIYFQSPEKTLTSEDVQPIVEGLIHHMEEKFSAKLR